MNIRRRYGVLAALVVPAAIAAQEPEVRGQLTARGLPADLAQGVASVTTDAAARGLPIGPLVDKALEGWAKRAQPSLILTVVRQFAGRMGDARGAIREAGVAEPPGEVIAAAAEAMGRGISGEQVGSVVRAAPTPPLAAPGLRVAAALAAQGLAADVAVTIVADALRSGRTAAQILDLPSVMRAMQAQGVAAPEIGRRMLQGMPEQGAGPRLPGAGGQMPLGPGGTPMGPGGRPGSGQPPIPPRGGQRPPRRP